MNVMMPPTLVKISLFTALFILGLESMAVHPMGEPSVQDSEREQAIAQFETTFQDGRAKYGTLEDRMKLLRVPGLSMALLKDGNILWAKGYGVLSTKGKTKVDSQTVFSVGSVSKLLTAVISLRLADSEKLNVDKDINAYMKRWQVPPSKFTTQKSVTLRHIMSHTAGFTVHGFPDFMPGEDLPSVLDTLKGQPPAKHGPVIVNFEPGSQFRYSGGGTTVQQLIIEDVTGMKFVDAARQWVFNPLGMNRSTFLNPIPATHGNIANAHNQAGMPVALPRGWEAMPEMAASGLWTTPSDMALLIKALIQAYKGEKASFLSQSLVQDMMTRVEPSKFGLGPFFYEKELFGHGGSNNSYKARVMAHLESGNGVIIFTNGRNGGAMINEVVEAVRRMDHF